MISEVGVPQVLLNARRTGEADENLVLPKALTPCEQDRRRALFTVLAAIAVTLRQIKCVAGSKERIRFTNKSGLEGLGVFAVFIGILAARPLPR